MGRRGTLVAITALLASQAFVGTASAADTRLIYVGSGPVGTAPGVLTLTPVSAGGTTVTNVIVKNIDNQTLSHVVLTFQAPATGLSLSGWFGTNAASCAPGASAPLVCDFGNLAKNQTRTLSVYYDATSAVAAHISAQISFNETKPNGGGNTHIEPIGGDVTVTNGGCNALATFLPPGVAKTLLPDDGTACPNDPQRSALIIPAAPGGNVATVDDNADATGCPSGYSCFGKAVSATVNDGATVSPYLTWQIFYPAATLGNINASKVAFVHDTKVIQAGKKGACANAQSTDCIDRVEVTAAGATFFIRTPTNGLIKGMH
jgi:hypothetical protein